MSLKGFAPPILPLARLKKLIDQSSSAFVSIKDLGALGNGVTDDSAAIQAAMNALAGTGTALWFPRGTYLHQTTVNIPSGMLIRGSPDAVLLGDINGAYPLTGSIWRAGITGAATGTTTVAAGGVVVGSKTIPVNSTVGAVVGGFLFLSSPGTGNRQSYKIESVAVGSVTVDRPVIARPFIAGDNVSYFAADQIPQDILIDGCDMHVRGKAIVTISLQTAWNCVVRDLIFDQGSPTSPSDACFGFNNACYACYAEGLYGDMVGGGAPSVIFAPESSEACEFVDCIAKNGANAGFEFVNSFACAFIGCLSEGNGSAGFAWTNDIVVTNGSDYCVAIACQAIGNVSHGFDIGDHSTDAVAADCESNYNGGTGYRAEAGTLRASFSGKAVGNVNGALVVVATAKSTVVPYLNIADNTNFNLNIGDDCSIGMLAGTCTGAAGAEILVQGGDVTIGEINLTHDVGPAVGILKVTGGRVRLGEGQIVAGTNGDVCIWAQGGVILTGAVTCRIAGGAAGVFGAFADNVAGSCVRMQDGFDADATATPFSAAGAGTLNRGSFTLPPPGPIPFPDMKSSDRVKITLAALGGAGTGLSPVITQTPAVGFAVAGPGGDTSTWIYEIS